MRSKLVIAFAVIAVPAMLYWIGTVTYAQYKTRHTWVEYYIPARYTGWVTIKYGVKSASAIESETDGLAGNYLVTIPDNGYLETRSPRYADFHQERFYWYDTNGNPINETTTPLSRSVSIKER